MPSVEIICIGQEGPIDFSKMPMAVRAKRELKSHRSPRPLFQEDFDQLQGCIYHLGSPRLKDPQATGSYTAGDLLIDWWEIIYFKRKFVPAMRLLLETLLAASPEGRVLFTSDYQFGPSKVRRYKRSLTLQTFWKRHDAKKLHTNALYWLTKGKTHGTGNTETIL